MEPNAFTGQDEPTLVPPSSEDRTLAILSHILTIVGGFIAPLVIYLIKKNESAYVTAHARESLNFQLTLIIAYIVSFMLWLVFIGLFITWLIFIGQIVLVIMATIRAAEGRLYRYPVAIRFIK